MILLFINVLWGKHVKDVFEVICIHRRSLKYLYFLLMPNFLSYFSFHIAFWAMALINSWILPHLFVTLFCSRQSKTEYYVSILKQALDMIRGKTILLLMDSHLEGNFSTEEATALVDLASRCLQYEPRERPNTENLVATLAPLQTKSEVS